MPSRAPPRALGSGPVVHALHQPALEFPQICDGVLNMLQPQLYVKAKAETSWRFWVLYVHVCKMETIRQAYALAKENHGAPGVDGVTFEAIEEQGVDAFP